MLDAESFPAVQAPQTQDDGPEPEEGKAPEAEPETVETSEGAATHTVRMLSLLGQHHGVVFDGDHIARNVDNKTLQSLIDRFGPVQVEVLD